jgi:hypothetical protein
VVAVSVGDDARVAPDARVQPKVQAGQIDAPVVQRLQRSPLHSVWSSIYYWESTSEGAPMTFDIVVLPGDGVGPEVVAEGIKVLEAIGKRRGHRFSLHHDDVGGAAIEKSGPQQSAPGE